VTGIVNLEKLPEDDGVDQHEYEGV
jgi:hypothetical protein